MFRPLSSVLLVTLLAGSPSVFAQGKTAEQARADMVSRYLIPEGLKNARVLKALGTVPRHEFTRFADRKKSYLDQALPIGYQQTISSPYIVAYMTETLDPQPTDKVLEIGTGSGYQSAVLAELVSEVYSIEIVEGLARSAARRLKRLGYDNVTTKAGDGYLGWPEHAPFDKIIVTCSPEKVPQPLAAQLKEGGKMILPLGERYEQAFHLLEKRNGELVRTRLVPTLFVPMTGNAEDKREVQPDPANPKVKNGSFELDENDDGHADAWHYQRLGRLTSSDAKDGSVALEFENDVPGRLSQVLQGEALDARAVAKLSVSIWAKYEDTKAGPHRNLRPALKVYYYDKVRNRIGDALVAPFLGTSDWEQHGRDLIIPDGTREIIIQIGLNGGTGRLLVDDLKISVAERYEGEDPRR